MVHLLCGLAYRISYWNWLGWHNAIWLFRCAQCFRPFPDGTYYEVRIFEYYLSSEKYNGRVPFFSVRRKKILWIRFSSALRTMLCKVQWVFDSDIFWHFFYGISWYKFFVLSRGIYCGTSDQSYEHQLASRPFSVRIVWTGTVRYRIHAQSRTVNDCYIHTLTLF